MSKVQFRVMMATVTTAAVIAGGCSTLGSSTAGTAASPFCIQAEKLTAADVALLQASDGNAASIKDAWSALLTGAKGLQRVAPADLSSDYTVYLGWLDNFGAILGRHDYKLGDAVADEQFVSSTADQRFADARQRVGTYFDTTCHVSSNGLTDGNASPQADTSSAGSAPSSSPFSKAGS